MQSRHNHLTQPLVTAVLQIYAEADGPISVREYFRRMVRAGVVSNDRYGYERAQRLILRLRKSGELPWTAIAPPIVDRHTRSVNS